MAKRKSSRRRKKKGPKIGLTWQWIGVGAACVIIAWAAFVTLGQSGLSISLPRISADLQIPTLPSLEDIQSAVDDLYGNGELSPEPLIPPSGEAEIHMIDVGQALSILIRTPTGENALIDAGDRDDAQSVVDYLRRRKIDRLDLLIATHAHADHIGGMAMVVRSIDIGKIIMTDLPKEMQPTTKVYTDLLEAVAMRKYSITPAKAGASYALGDARLTIQGPVKNYGEMNDTSIVSRIVYGSTAFLIEGDAEKEAESDMLKAKRVHTADVLIAGHHGSSTSTSQLYLKAVRPRYVGISCGAGNTYGHPHEQTVERLQRAGCDIYRTDVDGDVVFYSDGKNIRVETNKKN